MFVRLVAGKRVQTLSVKGDEPVYSANRSSIFARTWSTVWISACALFLLSALAPSALYASKAGGTITTTTTTSSNPWITVSDASQLQTALNSLPASGGTLLLQNLVASGLSPVSVSQSHVTIRFVNCQLGYAGTGITITGADDALIGDDSTALTSGDVAITLNGATSARIEHLRVVQSGYSAFMITGAATNVRFVDDSATKYNGLNQTGHAGFFIYGPAIGILFDHCRTFDGNGNGFRMDSPSVLPSHVRVVNCDVEKTWGHSSEGITPVGNDIWVVNCRVYKSGATGILAFNGRAGTVFHNIFIIGNSIGDSSQQIAGNAAIQVNPTSNGIQGVMISNNVAWDDQSSPTSEVMISLTNGGQSGVIDSLSVTGNVSINQRNQAGISNQMPSADLTNSSLGLASAF